jgi:hypothetical protein
MAVDEPHAPPPESLGADGTGPKPGAADVPSFADDVVTPCGRLLSRIWEQARDTAQAADPHISSCPHCREAAEGLSAVTAASQALRTGDRPGLEALADRVMNIVRAEVRLGRLLPLADPDRALRIAESAAAKVLRQAADRVPGARAAACRFVPVGDGVDLRVTMTLAAALDRPLPDRIHQVRRSVLRSAGQDLGLAVTAVDITVVDVLEQEPPCRPGLTPGGA